METYLVGGAVRDQLLGLSVVERDWVVVGAQAETLLAQNYRQVGKDFPVFLHPDSGEEYALARTEKKRGAGHTGFSVCASPDVSLEQDLARRDLTINAIAQSGDGHLIDPYNGLADIAERRLRHVSDAFIEDPLRVLRVARFQAKLQHLGFSIADETLALMRTLSESGELLQLSAERIWREFDKALNETSPAAFIETLHRCGALQCLLPELDRRFHHSDNLPATEEKIGPRTLAALRVAALRNYSDETRWAIVLHSVDGEQRVKNLNAKVIDKRPTKGNLIDCIGQRVKAPKKNQRLAQLVNHHIDFCLRATRIKPDAIVDLLDRCDAWRRAEQFEQLLQVAEALIATAPVAQSPAQTLAEQSIALLRTAQRVCSGIGGEEFIAHGVPPQAIGESIRNARKVQIAKLQKQFKEL